MSRFVSIIIIVGTLSRIEAGNLSDFNSNLESRYNSNKNPWFDKVHNLKISINPGIQNSGFNVMDKKYGTHTLWQDLINIRPTNATATENNNDIDPEVARRFPEAVKLLEKLKELNKLKEERMWTFGDIYNYKPTNGTIGSIAYGRPDNGVNKIPANNNGNDKKPTNNNTSMIVISDGKVYFQAQPVVPDDKSKGSKQTVYYVRT